MNAPSISPHDVDKQCDDATSPSKRGDFAAHMSDALVYKVAARRWERESAFRLIHDGYVAKGLTTPHATGLRVTKWNLLSTTQMYIALQRNEIIYTMSLVADDWGGLPLEALYQEEVDELRAKHLSLAEVTCLSSSKKYGRRQMFDIFVRLVAVMFQQARYMGIDGLVIAVHPNHADFYRRQLGFARLGDEKAYPLVDGHPAVLCFHDFNALDALRYPLYERIYGTILDAERLEPSYMSDDDQEYFATIAECFASDSAMAVG